MRRTPILITIAALMTPMLFAQSRPSGSRPFKKTIPRTKAIVNISHPTKVTGVGISTPSGVRYWDIQKGEGSAAERGHVVKVLYMAWVENGKQFDGSPSIDRPTIFTLGAGQVIRGWEEGMEGMKAGGKRQIRIPAYLAYGSAGVPPLVPPNANLIFDIALIEVQ